MRRRRGAKLLAETLEENFSSVIKKEKNIERDRKSPRNYVREGWAKGSREWKSQREKGTKNHGIWVP